MEIDREEVKKKALLFDIETSCCLGYCFGKYEQDIFEFEKESRLLSFAYKWLGTKDIFCFIEKDFKNNKQLVEELWKLLNEADMAVGHNLKRFDFKKSNTFFIDHNLPPPSPFELVDTLFLARKYFAFEDNHLDGLGQRLGFGRKTMMPDKQRLWVRYTKGVATKKEWEILREYNKRDVELLEKIYLKLRGYDTIHKSIYVNDRGLCPLCGQDKLEARGWKYLANGLKRRQFVCKNCGKWSYSGWTIRHLIKDDIIK